MPVTIQKLSVAEIESAENFAHLLDEYGEESAIDGMPAPAAKMEIYRAIEPTGTFHVFAALDENTLIGFITLLITTLPHYSACVGVTESFFVEKKSRKTGAGSRLLAQAEEYTLQNGGVGLLVTAPIESNLAEVLPRHQYKPTNIVFFKQLK